MNTTSLRRWLPIALCCLPGVAIAAIVGIGLALGGAAFGTWLGGPLGLGLIALALLACPISMGLMMWRQRGSVQHAVPGGSATATTMMHDCCPPGQVLDTSEADRLAALRARREALEREVAEMQTR